MRNRTVVIPDLHQAPNLDAIDVIIEREKPDLTVFLGDYFDQFFDSPDEARRTAEWLSKSLQQSGRVHLMGNHDLVYAYAGHAHVHCSGFTVEKAEAIDSVLRRSWLQELPFYRWEGGILYSHAGLSSANVPADVMGSDAIVSFLSAAEREAREHLSRDLPHWIYASGRRRGGRAPAGGLVWCDIHEFQPIPQLNQIFGHTPRNVGTVRRGPASCNVCLDSTDPLGLKHYLVVETDRIAVKEITGQSVKDIDIAGGTSG